MNIHCVGIGGIGLSALAQLLHARGDHVTGSDSSDGGMVPKLRELGIEITVGHRVENLPKDARVLVYSEAVPIDAPERVAAADRGVRQCSYFEFLGEVTHDYQVIAVAGTHGKTTTTALAAVGAIAADLDPTVVVGTTLREFGETNFHLGASRWLLVEACEYRENFKFLEPEIVLLTGVEHDHFDAFPTEGSYFSAFKNFIKNAKVVIHHADDAGAARVLENFHGAKIAVPRQSTNSWKYMLKISGQYNYDNATLALALGHTLELNLDIFKKALGEYRGAGRRQELIGQKNGVQIIDDYAHHPSELTALISGIREKNTGKIAVIFEPHQHSRTLALLPEFIDALALADAVGLHPIYPARDTAKEIAAMPDKKLIEAVPGAVPIRTHADVSEFIKKLAPGDTLVFAGAGKISVFAREWRAR